MTTCVSGLDWLRVVKGPSFEKYTKKVGHFNLDGSYCKNSNVYTRYSKVILKRNTFSYKGGKGSRESGG